MENNNTENDCELRIEHCELALPAPPAEAHYTVYKLTDPNGKVYIGCTGRPVEKRWGYGWQYNKNSQIHRAFRKIGWKNFKKEILCENLTKEGGSKLEKWFITYYDSTNPEKGYNRALGGLGKGFRLSEVSREACSKSKCLLYEKDPEYRKRVSKGVQAAYENDPEYRERVRKGIKAAYENDPSYRERVSKALINTYENNYEMMKEKQDFFRKYYQSHTEKREKQSRWMKEYLSKPGNRAFVESSKKAKPVVCVETGVIYPSQHAAEKAVGFHGVHKACGGLLHTCGGYHWRYVDCG